MLFPAHFRLTKTTTLEDGRHVFRVCEAESDDAGTWDVLTSNAPWDKYGDVLLGADQAFCAAGPLDAIVDRVRAAGSNGA